MDLGTQPQPHVLGVLGLAARSYIQETARSRCRCRPVRRWSTSRSTTLDDLRDRGPTARCWCGAPTSTARRHRCHRLRHRCPGSSRSTSSGNRGHAACPARCGTVWRWSGRPTSPTFERPAQWVSALGGRHVDRRGHGWLGDADAVRGRAGRPDRDVHGRRRSAAHRAGGQGCAHRAAAGHRARTTSSTRTTSSCRCRSCRSRTACGSTAARRSSRCSTTTRRRPCRSAPVEVDEGDTSLTDVPVTVSLSGGQRQGRRGALDHGRRQRRRSRGLHRGVRPRAGAGRCDLGRPCTSPVNGDTDTGAGRGPGRAAVRPGERHRSATAEATVTITDDDPLRLVGGEPVGHRGRTRHHAGDVHGVGAGDAGRASRSPCRGRSRPARPRSARTSSTPTGR